jgi:hypothetical protein
VNTILNNMKIGTCVSTTRELKHGIPQRSVLGPILLLLYINNLHLNLTGLKRALFADDTNILESGKNVTNLQYKINNVMTELQTRFKLNNPVINAERRRQCPSIRCKIKDQCHHILYLKVEIFNTTRKQIFWVYT